MIGSAITESEDNQLPPIIPADMTTEVRVQRITRVGSDENELKNAKNHGKKGGIHEKPTGFQRQFCKKL